MLKRIYKYIFRVLISLSALGMLAILLPRLITALQTYASIYEPDSAPGRRVAIVFGAGLHRDGSPTPILRDRVATAAKLYFSGKVEKLLLSGDNQSVNHDEPGAMRAYALQIGVPYEDIILDYAGRRTYDTCFRANKIFEVRSAILVTQRFHLPRALYLCNALGVQSVGVSADQRHYQQRSLLYWNLREIVATPVAMLQVHLTKPLPVLGDPEPIFSEAQ